MSKKTNRIPFHLAGPAPDPDPVATPREDLPAQVAGQPASYFWKEMIHTGSYAQPGSDEPLVVDASRLQRWADVGSAMLGAGIAIPINCDHSDTARDTVGYVKEFKLDGDKLLGLCQFIGNDAALTAARNQVSVGIDPDFIDGESQNWGEAIVHLALTPVPVVPDQGEFQEIPTQTPPSLDDDSDDTGAADLSTSIPVTADQLQSLQELLGQEISPVNCMDLLIDHLRQNESPDAETELSASGSPLIEMSMRSGPAISPEGESALVELTTSRFDAAVERGWLSPGARDKLVAALVKSKEGPPNLIALSRNGVGGGDQNLAMTIAEILLDNPPIVLGESTGLQSLSRMIPGQESHSVDQLRQYMTKVASVSG